MTEEQRKKEKFVERHLSPMLCDVGCSISGAEYYIDEYNSEIVELHYIGGSSTKVCVSCDSLPALVRDVFRRV